LYAVRDILLPVRLLGQALDPLQPLLPSGRNRSHGRNRLVKPLGLHAVANLSSLTLSFDKPTAAQHTEMLGNGLPTERKLPRDRRRRCLAPCEEDLKDVATAWFGNSSPGRIVAGRASLHDWAD
jgi:hypothetical protein